ncbi:MAG TPA: gliding motility-associated protein GldE [Chitinophagales bacterium]|nr:gliding motility-associated protein GldE [Chitinophagales bacterium]
MDSGYWPFHFILLQAFFNAPTGAIVAANLAIVVLIGISGLMSASEIAFFSFSGAEIATLNESEDPIELRIGRLLAKPRYLLSTIVITNNLTNIGVVITSYFVTRKMLNFNDVALGNFTIPAYVIEFLWNLVVVTFLLMLFGEATPKVYAAHNKMKIARAMSGIMILMNRFYYPLNWVLVGSTKQLEKRLKRQNTEIDIEEINKAIEITVAKKESSQDVKLLKGIVHFGNITVRQVMRPRTEIAAIDEDLNFKQVIAYIKETGYSRLPVYKETPDNIVGVLNIKDLLEHLNQDETFGWQSLAHKPFFVPEGKKIDDLLREIQQNRRHMAIVVDEFGGTSGVITLEDIIEEVVGDIRDEFDDSREEEFKKLDDRTFMFGGNTPLNDACRLMEISENAFDEARDEAETLAGLVLELTRRIPKNGEEVKFAPFKFTVVSVLNNRIEKIKITNEA